MGRKKEWGIIDPVSDSFTEINGLDYFFTSNGSSFQLDKNKKFLDFLFSDSGNSLILTTRETKDGIIVNQLMIYSLSDGSYQSIDQNSLSACSEQGLDGLTSWSSDGMYLLGYCWANFDEATTAILFDLSSNTSVDMRDIVQTTAATKAALSHDGNKIAIENDNMLFLYQNNGLQQMDLINTYEVNYPQIIQWSKDDTSIFYDNHGESISLQEFNFATGSDVKIIGESEISTKIDPNHQNSRPFDWDISPNNRMIVLSEIPAFWIYHLPE